MARHNSHHTDETSHARPEWDDRDVVPPRDRFGGSTSSRQGHDPYAAADREQEMDRYRGGSQDRMDLPPAASPGMAGWAAPYDEPMPRRGQGSYPEAGRGRQDDYARSRDDRRMGQGYAVDHPRGGRDFFERASDEVASWFGDNDAQRRRDEDHRGRGPKSYTRSDARIEEDVNDRLTEDGAVDASDITVTVKDREVTLDGHVHSRHAKRQAEDCAESVSGVMHVQNNLRVKQPDIPGAPPSAGAL